MPRQAHGRPLQRQARAPPAKNRTIRSRGLNALEIAERENPTTVKIRQHRLGEVEDDPDESKTRDDLDGRSSKRRKIVDEPYDEYQEDGDPDGEEWHEGVDNEEEDSEIDSDEAFGESDEERFEGFTFRGSKQQSSKNIAGKVQSATTNSVDKVGGDFSGPADGLDPVSQTEEEDDLGDEAVDLATAWDMDDQDQEEQSMAAKKAQRKRREQSPRASESADSDRISAEEEEDEESEEEKSELSFSGDEEEGDLVKLQSFVEALNPEVNSIPATRARADWKNLPNKPSQFGTGATKVTAADLLQYVTDPAQRQALKLLERSDRNGPEQYKGGIPGKLAAPLAKRQQDRLDREAAYEKSKDTLARWVETVKQNRRAEHISFPLQDSGAQSALSTKQFGPLQLSKPMTSLENTIHGIMQESGMQNKIAEVVDDEERGFEELEEKKVSPEEVLARRIELRKQRDLLFREEIRARRIKKIKSKAYRRVHRKERDKAEVRRKAELSEIGMLDSEDEREKNDRRRAEERMGARHRESKWAKAVKTIGRAAWDEDGRGGVADLVRRDDELRRRVEGRTVRSPDASDPESDSESGDASNADEEIEHLEDKLTSLQDDHVPKLPSTLGSMAFMQRAEAARKAANDANIKELRRNLRRGKDVEDDTEAEDESETGRQRYGGSKQEAPAQLAPKPIGEFEERLSDDEVDNDDGLDSTVLPKVPSRSQGSISGNQAARPPMVPSSDRPNIENQMKNKTKQDKRSVQKLLGSSTATVNAQLDDFTSSSEPENDLPKPESHFDKQAILASAIFAGGDDVIHEFNKEKKEAVKEDDDQVIDNTLPGWGSWTGVGVSKRDKKQAQGRFLTTIKGIAPEKRQDAKLDRVIINEKRIKKNGKYLATELPHPFESRQQYERSLRLPLGPEWTTKTTFQDATKPRVLMKQGIIRPMAKPMV